MTREEINKLRPGDIVIYSVPPSETSLIVIPGKTHDITFADSGFLYWGTFYNPERYRLAEKDEQVLFMAGIEGNISTLQSKLEELKCFRSNCREWRRND